MEQLQQTVDILENLDEKVETLYKYQSVMNYFSLLSRDYGTGIIMSEVEAHTLNYIQKEEGLTVTRLAEITDRTKSAVSQIVSRLSKQGLVRREVNPCNKREYKLFVTKTGHKTCEAHRRYDREGILAQINFLLENCTPEEIDGFFKVLQHRIIWFKRVNNAYGNKESTRKKRSLLMSAKYSGC